jgi:hypothetical protein
MASDRRTAARFFLEGYRLSSHVHGRWNATARTIAHAIAVRNGASRA